MTLDPDKLHIIHSKPKHDSHADAIRRFEGDYECLSNTYRCPVSLRGDPEPYPSVEHALQASKTDAPELKDSIRQAKTAIEAKKIARVIKPTSEWRAGSEKVVEALVRDKFRRNAKARAVLVGTGHVKLVYTNTHDDRVWGVCGGKGDNKLGKLLERVRGDALSGKDTDVWCTMRFQLALPLDVAVSLAVTKEGKVVSEPSFEGKPVVRMGKLADNEVVMAHPSVSRFHALLVIDKTLGAFLVDLGASNGSFVNGRRLAPYVPEPIMMGGEELTFAKSKRTYVLSRVENDLREAKKRDLYANMSNPVAAVSKPEPDSTVYVGNMDPSTAEGDLREFFSECGDIVSIRIPQDKETGKNRGIAFVAFAKRWGVLHALTLNMDDLKGQSVKVRRADSNPDKNKMSHAKSPAASRPGPTDAGGQPRAGSAGMPGSSATRREGNGAAPAAGGVGGISGNALEQVKAEALMRAAQAARANAVGLQSTAVGKSDTERGTKRPRGESGDRYLGTSAVATAADGAARGGGGLRKRSARWGDSADGAGGSKRERIGHDGRDETERRGGRYAIEGEAHDRHGDYRSRDNGDDTRARSRRRDPGDDAGSGSGGSAREREGHGRGSVAGHERGSREGGGRDLVEKAGRRREKRGHVNDDDSSERPPRRTDDGRGDHRERRADDRSRSRERGRRGQDEEGYSGRDRRDRSRPGVHDNIGRSEDRTRDGRNGESGRRHRDDSRERQR